ncbi:MAG: amidohydrolase [Thermofilum sp.]|nr:amidohydrolase [Thermofilum sp.]
MKASVPAVDFHTHIGEVKSFSPRLKGWVRVGVEDLLSYMGEQGVERAVVLSLPPDSDPYAKVVSNRRLLEAVEPHAGRLVPFCCPNPLNARAAPLFKRMVGEGCRGLGELKVQLRIDDPRVVKLLKAAESLGVPALVHIEEGPLFNYCYGVDKLEDVLKLAPDLKLVVHGPGWWRHVSAEPGTEAYPKGPVKGEGLVHRLLRRYDNLYADISASSGLNALARDPEHARRFLEEFQDRVVFGTDFPCLSEEGQFGTDGAHLRLIGSLQLPERAARKILRENAEKLLA